MLSSSPGRVPPAPRRGSDRRPQLADLRESGSIEQDADVVMLLYRPEYYVKYRDEENVGLAEVVVAKQRNGPTGNVKLQFFNTTMRLSP